MAQEINDEFMQQVIIEQAWKSLSEEFGWTESLLEKYADKVDWKEISDNRNIVWTIPMLQKFSKKLDWKVLSGHADRDWLTEAHLEVLKDKWDWSELSSEIKLTESEIDKFIDYIDWTELIGAGRSYIAYDMYDFDAVQFYEKYKQYIPMSKLQDSRLWEKIVEQKSKQLVVEILS